MASILSAAPSGRGGDRKDNQAVFYWYKTGHLCTGNILRQHINAVWLSLVRGIQGRAAPRVSLIRLSTGIRDMDEVPAAMARLKAFGREIFPEIEARLE